MSWVVSPLLSGILVLILFSFIRAVILRREQALKYALTFLPFFYFLTCSIIAFSIIYDGTPALKLNSLSIWKGVLISLGFGLAGGIFGALIVVPVIKRYLTRNQLLYPRFDWKQKLRFLFCCGKIREIQEDEVKEPSEYVFCFIFF